MLLAIEGIDRAGKTTLAKNIASRLRRLGRESLILHSPGEETKTLVTIRALSEVFEREDDPQKLGDIRQTLHNLFLANKFEMQPRVRDALNRGVFVIYDRYIVSGLTYSLMDGMDIASAHKGLILPDATLYLEIIPSDAQRRDGFGEGFREDAETHEMSHRSMVSVVESLRSGLGNYGPLKHPIVSINANRSPKEVGEIAFKTIEVYDIHNIL